MQDILSLRGQMQTVSKTATCSIEFMLGDEVQLWWVDGAKSFNATIPIYGLDMRHKKFKAAFKEAKKVMR